MRRVWAQTIIVGVAILTAVVVVGQLSAQHHPASSSAPVSDRPAPIAVASNNGMSNNFPKVSPDGLVKIDAPATDFFRSFDRALDLACKNQIDDAIAEWKKAVGLNPEEAKAYFNLALAAELSARIALYEGRVSPR